MYIKTFAVTTACVIATLTTGCATKATSPMKMSVEKSRTFDAPFEVVWPAIIGSIAETNLKISTLEKASGLIALFDGSYSARDADEGTRGSVKGIPDQVIARSASLNIFATYAEPNKTTVRVNVGMKMNVKSGNGLQMFPFVYRWEESYSNGNLEKSILDGIANKISKQ